MMPWEWVPDYPSPSILTDNLSRDTGQLPIPNVCRVSNSQKLSSHIWELGFGSWELKPGVAKGV